MVPFANDIITSDPSFSKDQFPDITYWNKSSRTSKDRGGVYALFYSSWKQDTHRNRTQTGNNAHLDRPRPILEDFWGNCRIGWFSGWGVACGIKKMHQQLVRPNNDYEVLRWKVKRKLVSYFDEDIFLQAPRMGRISIILPPRADPGARFT